MKSFYTLGILAVALTFGSMARAYPTLNAETGIVVLPNALTAQNGSVVGAADMLFADENTFKARVLYGVDKNLEVGASLSTGITDGISISSKYRFTDPQSTFNLAAGGSLTLANHDQTAVDLYLVGTQAFSRGKTSVNPILGTFGVHFITENSDNTLRPFVGVQCPIGNNTQVAAEYQLKDGTFYQKPLTSVVLRHYFTTDWSAQIGVTNGTGFGSTTEVRPFVGVQYNFTQTK